MRFNLRFARVLLSTTGLALGLAGCSSSHPQLVEDLPPPNFNGPSVAPARSAPLAVAPKTSVPTPRPAQVRGGIPREWLPSAGASRSWRWIVIHHSATPAGSARLFDRMHRDKGWDELGYHFVIGNGTDSADGQIETGPRWAKQKWGAHAKTANNEYNDFGIGICLVGNFDVERPTAQQTRALARLVAHLMKSYDVPATRVVGHADTGKPTECPGRNMNIAAVRQMATQMAASGSSVADDKPLAGSSGFQDLPPSANVAGELLRPTADAAHVATEP